ESLGREGLTLQIDVCPQVDDVADGPAQRYSNHSAQQAHSPGFGKKEFFDIAVAGADGFHDPNFAPPLQNSHDQSVHNTDRGHGQRQAAKNSQEEVEHSEELPQAAGGVENGERVEPQFLDGLLDRFNLL